MGDILMSEPATIETDSVDVFDLNTSAVYCDSHTVLKRWWVVSQDEDRSWWVYLHPNSNLYDGIKQGNSRWLSRYVTSEYQFGWTFAELYNELVREMRLGDTIRKICVMRQGIGGPGLLVLNPSTETMEGTRGEYTENVLIATIRAPFAVDDLRRLGRKAEELRF